MDKWKSTALALGSVRAGEKTLFSFESTRALENIEDLVPSCGSCTKVKGYDPGTGKLELEFSTGEFPVHLSMEGKTYYDTTKNVTVKYQDGTGDRLYFSVRVYK